MADILGEKKICKICGKCCRLISSLKSYDVLCKEAKRGDVFAVNFLKLFLPYTSLDDVLEIDAVAVEAIIQANKIAYGEDVQTYFYYCRYIGVDNRCGVYDMRPKLCRLYPKNEFIPLPTDCAYEGYSFMAREKVKAKVRKAKEQLLDIKVMRQGVNNRASIEKLNKLERDLNRYIDSYKAFGANNW